jgi:hypothetical protein
MNVIALTILVSSCLAGIFIFCFAGEFRRSRHPQLPTWCRRKSFPRGCH